MGENRVTMMTMTTAMSVMSRMMGGIKKTNALVVISTVGHTTR